MAGISHELNTPIGNALIATTALQEQTRQLAAQLGAQTIRRTTLEEFVHASQEMSELALQAITQSAKLISSFKQVAIEQTSESRRSFDLRRLIDDNLANLKAGPGFEQVVLHNLIDEELLCDSYPGPLSQVLLNLIHNALLHGIGDRQDGRIEIRAHQDQQSIHLEVLDNGRGMAPNVLAHIFDPFFTTTLGKGGLRTGALHLPPHRHLGAGWRPDGSLGAGQRQLLYPLLSPHRPWPRLRGRAQPPLAE